MSNYEITDPEDLVSQIEDLSDSARSASQDADDALNHWQSIDWNDADEVNDENVDVAREAVDYLDSAISQIDAAIDWLRGPLSIEDLIEAAEEISGQFDERRSEIQAAIDTYEDESEDE